jgi:hypothetical protein
MKNILIWTCKIFLSLTGFLLLYAGFMWSFMPELNLIANNIEVGSVLGMNMIKSDIGAPLLVGGTFLLLFAFKGNEWFLPMFILGGAYFIVRTISFFIDGSHPTIIFGIGLEGVVLLALYGLYRLRQ